MDLIYNNPLVLANKETVLQENQTLAHYHLDALQIAKTVCGLEGLKVLEVGGSMPRKVVFESYNVARWFSVEDFDYWNELPSSSTAPTALEIENALADAPTPDASPPYQVYRGKIEDLPYTFHGQFDRIFSVACFEHVHNL